MRGQVRTLNPTSRLLVTSATNGEGLDDWCEVVSSALAAKRPAVATA